MPRQFNYTELSNGVRTLSDHSVKWWNDHLGVYNYSPKDVCDLLTRGLPGDRDNLLERIDTSADRTSLEIKGLDQQGEIFWASRTLLFRSRELNLDVLKIREDYQSQGYGKIQLRNAYRFAKALGFVRLTITAVDAGSYAWSKAGFLASVQSWKHAYCRGRIEAYIQSRRVILGSPLTSELLAYARSDDPRALWALAVYDDLVPLLKNPDIHVPLGFAILRESESSWYGRIELVDGTVREKQIALVRNYIGLNTGE